MDYQAELKQEKDNKALKPGELKLVENRLKDKYKEKLSEEIVRLISKVKADSIRELKEEGIIDSNIDVNEQEYIIKQSILKKNSESEISEEWDEKWLNESDKCPACGTKIDSKAVICPECGLTIK